MVTVPFSHWRKMQCFTNKLVWRSFQSFHWFRSFWPSSFKFSGRLFISDFRSFPFVLLILELFLLSLICSPCCRCLRPANWWARPSSRWNSSSKEKERKPGQFLFHDLGIRFLGSGYSFLLDVVPGLDLELGLPRLKCKWFVKMLYFVYFQMLLALHYTIRNPSSPPMRVILQYSLIPLLFCFNLGSLAYCGQDLSIKTEHEQFLI
jgi:hypothetical protein